MTRRKVLLGGGAAVLVGGAVVTAVAQRDTRDRPAAPPATTTAPVSRTNLAASERLDGTLGYGTARVVLARVPGGTLTWLPEPGRTVRRGEQVFGVDGHRVPLFYGSSPLWRTLAPGVPDGADVRIVERNLRALGCGDDVTVDRSFTWRTAEAIECWQDRIGVPETGRLEPGDVVVAPAAVRVSSVDAAAGGPSTGTVLRATGTERIVTVDVPVARQQLGSPGAEVRVELPGGRTTGGHVSRIGTTASAASAQDGAAPGQNGDTGQRASTGTAAEDATVPVEITLDRDEDAGRLEGAPVTVTFTGQRRDDVLAVPVSALLARPGGTYVVNVVDAAGRRTSVPVRPGLFADGRVEVTGHGLAAGMRVEVPSP